MKVEEFLQMVKIKHPECILPISRLSLDENNKMILCDSDRQCFGYDVLIKKLFFSKKFPASVDAIAIGGGYLNFIEFKNGKITSEIQKNIRQKVFEGTYIFERDVLDKTFLKDLDMPTRFVLVYNESANQNEGKSQQMVNDGIIAMAGTVKREILNFKRFIGEQYHRDFHIFSSSMSVSDKYFLSNLDCFVGKEN